MKAIVKLEPGEGLSFEEVALPELGDEDVLIKIKKTSICGTDLHIFEWDPWAAKTIQPPLIIGHEFMGEVVKLGKGVTSLSLGDRVTGEGHLTCGKCRLCRSAKKHLCANALSLGIHRNGAFADYLCLPSENVIRLPDDIPDDIASILDPLGNAVHSVFTTEVAGEDVLITGAGPIGLMTLALLKQLDAHSVVVTDVNAYRLALAEQFKATRTVNIREESLEQVMKELHLESGFTVGFEMSGNADAIAQQINCLAPGSTLAALGIAKDKPHIDWNTLIFKGLTLQGIYGRKMFETWTKMLALVQTGLNLSPLITHHFPAKDFLLAFQLAQSGKAGKIILNWD